MTSIEPLKSLYVTLEKDDITPQTVNYRGQFLRLASIVRRYAIKVAGVVSGKLSHVEIFESSSINYYQHESKMTSFLPENILNNPFRYLKDPCDYIQSISKEIIKGDYDELQVFQDSKFVYKETKEESSDEFY